MIISVHIPKTAGTTLATYLDHSTNRSILYDYGASSNLVIDSDVLNKHKDFIEKFKVIHGHFAASKYKNVFPNAEYITFVRQPSKRIISNYLHLKRVPSHPMAKKIESNKMSILEFAKQFNQSNALSIHMDGLSLNEWSFIGITEHSEIAIPMMLEHLGIPSLNPYKLENKEYALNVKPEYQDTKEILGDDEEAVISKLNNMSELQKDINIYNQSMDMFLEKCQKSKISI